ncbi:putative acetyltransferase [Desulforapulum autotrophicum HRM2]|uniref:Acetyltransferase n=1 Tax=Desulforapulum autotrophicum (strain ATCC 43914 / DSM 3382 / VKM B-1955 / HRM2) TaxID=177437 RepID=C0QM68_DESAH|nr:GNAT family protein [Desulforapulum autotrophicum]ACN16385.1 putative acetyltransferase [Desulforapulum autotrophicum HRM2]
MKLIPFTPDDYTLLVGWIPDEVSNLQWSGALYEWPLTTEQIKHHVQSKNVTPFLVESKGKQVGFVELIRESDEVYRLCRVLIANQAARGSRVEKELLQMAIDHAQSQFGAKKIKLSVFEQNIQAIKCYLSLGFKITASEKKFHKFKGQWWPLLRMEMAL